MTATLRTTGLTKSYSGRTVVRGVDLEIASGEVVGTGDWTIANDLVAELKISGGAVVQTANATVGQGSSARL